MVYKEYIKMKEAVRLIQEEYQSILDEEEELFLMTQPKGVRYDKEKVSGSHDGNAFETFLIKKQERNIEERLFEVKWILAERKELLAEKERELRASQAIEDKVYVMRFIEHRRITKIERALHYSRAQIFRIISQIKHETK